RCRSQRGDGSPDQPRGPARRGLELVLRRPGAVQGQRPARRRVIDFLAVSGLPLVGVNSSSAFTFTLPVFFSFFSALPFALTTGRPDSGAVLPAADLSVLLFRVL